MLLLFPHLLCNLYFLIHEGNATLFTIVLNLKPIYHMLYKYETWYVKHAITQVEYVILDIKLET